MEIKVLASGSKGNCYRISDGQTPILIECGIPLAQISMALDFHLSNIAGCLISHGHGDHCQAVKGLCHMGIPCYASAGTIKELTAQPLLYRLEQANWIGSLLIQPFDVKHDAAEPVGFVIDSNRGSRLLYLTDAPYSQWLFPGLTHIMVECNYALDILHDNLAQGEVDRAVKRRVIQNHMSLETVKKMLQANDLSRVQEIWLLHLSDSNSDAERFRREVQEITGKVVKVA